MDVYVHGFTKQVNLTKSDEYVSSDGLWELYPYHVCVFLRIFPISADIWKIREIGKEKKSEKKNREEKIFCFRKRRGMLFGCCKNRFTTTPDVSRHSFPITSRLKKIYHPLPFRCTNGKVCSFVHLNGWDGFFFSIPS